MHANSFDTCRSFVAGVRAASGPLRVADIGSRDINGTYRPLFDGWSYTGFDIEAGDNVDVILPAPCGWDLGPDHMGAYDLIVCGQTLKHTPAPWRVIHDIAALIKPGGILWLAVPNTEVFHEYPVDCWRVWPDGMRALFDEAGLLVVDCYASGPDTFGIARKP